MRVLLRGPVLTNSGYGVHSRQIFEWLDQKKDVELTVECLNWGITPWIINPNAYGGMIERIMGCSRELQGPYDVALQVQLPDEWDASLGKKNVGISAFVETDKCSSAWIAKCNEMDAVVVPSTFTKNVARRSGPLQRPIHVVPEWFNHDILNKEQCIKLVTNKNDSRYRFDTKFNFLIISQLTAQNPEDDRKNLFNGIKWICETFEGSSDVGIVIKTNMGKGTSIDRQLTTNLMNEMIRAIGKKNFPKIYLLHGNMTSQEIASLYYHPDIKCFVSPTRGEGYGLPLIDAAAAGMPIIATNWSGHLQFLERNMFLPVDYKMKEIPKSKVDNRIFYEGFRWAEPNRNDFVKSLLNVYQNYPKFKEKSQNYSKKVCEEFSKQSIMGMYDKILFSV